MGYLKGTTHVSNSRDIPILTLIRDSKFITHGQLYELMKSTSLEYSRESFTWRMRRLTSGGFVSRCEGNFGQGEIIYRVTRRGLIQLESHGKFAAVLNSQTGHLPPPSQIYHALELCAVRLALVRKNLLLYWKSDVEIASENTVSADPLAKDYDAIVDVWNEDRAARFGLEYERTVKGVQQYERIRRAIEQENALHTILYLTSGDQISRHLANQMAGVNKRLAFATTEAFRQGLLDTPVLIYSGDPPVPFRSQLGGVF